MKKEQSQQTKGIQEQIEELKKLAIPEQAKEERRLNVPIKGVAIYTIAFLLDKKLNKVVEFHFNNPADRKAFEKLATFKFLAENRSWTGAMVKIPNPKAGQKRKDGENEKSHLLVKCWACKGLRELYKLEDGELKVTVVEKEKENKRQDGTPFTQFYIVSVDE